MRALAPLSCVSLLLRLRRSMTTVGLQDAGAAQGTGFVPRETVRALVHEAPLPASHAGFGEA